MVHSRFRIGVDPAALKHDRALAHFLWMPLRLIMASGGIEAKIPTRLNGLQYVYAGEGLLPHPRIAEWIKGRVAMAIKTTAADDEPHGARPVRLPIASLGQL